LPGANTPTLILMSPLKAGVSKDRRPSRACMVRDARKGALLTMRV